ncbi:MAG: response regulator, partial [Desulfocapsa sp.]|nr:response regulator [Desulfocapsa sp.]
MAKNGREAVDAFIHSDFDLVFMDIEMPVMDGYEATRKIRQWEKEQDLKATPIIALTAHAFIRFRKKCLDAGCSDFLTKPIRRATLLHSISTHLKSTKEDIQAKSGPRVTLDPKIKQLVPKFLCNKQKDAEELTLTIESEHTEELQIKAHTMKGTSWMYGFKELGDLCFNLEQAAKNTDLPQASLLAAQIKEYLENVQISYK